jgi:hypothetical protein
MGSLREQQAQWHHRGRADACADGVIHTPVSHAKEAGSELRHPRTGAFRLMSH